MTSVAQSMIAIAGLLSMFPAAQTLACHALDREIIEVKADKIGGYTEAGKFDRDLTRAEVMNKKVVRCSEVNSALAKIMLSDERPVWIDLTEVKLIAVTCEEPGTKSMPGRIAGVHSRPADEIEAVTSGIGSCK